MAPTFSPKATPPRGPTSRLMGMKFMNRLGGDSTPASSPLASAKSTPQSGKKSGARTANEGDGDDDDDRRSTKRRKTLSGSPSTQADISMAAMQAEMKASVEEEERKRQEAVKKRAAELGDEHWTWELPPEIAAKIAKNKEALAKQPQIGYVGWAEIDKAMQQDSDDDSDEETNGQPFKEKPNIMRFNMKKASESDDDDDDDDDDGDSKNQKNGSRKRSRSDANSSQKKKEPHVKLKGLTSLSSQGGQSSSSSSSKMTCHRCGKPGHKASGCPSSNSKRRR